ncbi:hypothetical protein OBV_01530 [Oscillibacter valericigenes Sjm18-20]|nr:hypothetical protein OBV_01530 [Oscillibacter valericigenes Sjm18-20]
MKKAHLLLQGSQDDSSFIRPGPSRISCQLVRRIKAIAPVVKVMRASSLHNVTDLLS